MVLTPGPQGRLLVLSALALSACTGDAPSAPAALPADGGLVLSAEGLGGVGADTPLDAARIAQALPDVTAEAAPAGDAAAVWVLRDGQLLAEVYAAADGRLGRIEVTGDVPGPDSLTVGQTFAASGLARRACAPGDAGLAGLVVCDADGVEAVFAHGWDGPSAELPPDDALADAFLARMVWRADG